MSNTGVRALLLLVLTLPIGSGFPLPQRQAATRVVVWLGHHAAPRATRRSWAHQCYLRQERLKTVVSQVDHVLLTTPDNGRTLVSLLTERLALPVVWPQPGSDWTASTGISLGNVNLEVFHREPPPQGAPPRVARISSLALQPTDLKIALNELRARGIAHDPPPESGSRPAGESPPRWTTVGLKGFGHGLFLIQYVFDMDERRLRFDRLLRERDGGPLGIVRVREVIIAPDRLDEVRAQWSNLLGPTNSGVADLWVVGDGPKIRLVKAGDPRAGDFIVEVKSLKRADDALRGLRISAETTKRQIRINPEGMSGLRLVLQEH